VAVIACRKRIVFIARRGRTFTAFIGREFQLGLVLMRRVEDIHGLRVA